MKKLILQGRYIALLDAYNIQFNIYDLLENNFFINFIADRIDDNHSLNITKQDAEQIKRIIDKYLQE
ncbi:MAG: hypothetical protein ACYC6W_10880 [Nitrosotalea sp.]